MSVPSDEDLLNMGTKYFYYKSRTGGAAGLQGKMDLADIVELDTQLADLNDKIRLAEIQEETYNEMYLNSKKNPSTFGLFSKVGLRNTQDWVLAYFFFSLTVFSLLLVWDVIKAPDGTLFTGIMWAGVMLSVGALATITIMLYG